MHNRLVYQKNQNPNLGATTASPSTKSLSTILPYNCYLFDQPRKLTLAGFELGT